MTPPAAGRVANLERYRQQALDSAALIAALATSRLDGESRLRELLERQSLQLRDLLHDFAYRARKTLEMARECGLDIQAELDRKSVVGQAIGSEEKLSADLESYSFAFVCNRIIHSRDLELERGQVPYEVDGRPASHDASWAFLVRSERDSQSARHFVFIEFYLERFLELDDAVSQFLDRLRRASGAARPVHQ